MKVRWKAILLLGVCGAVSALAQEPAPGASTAGLDKETKPLWEAGVFGGVARLPHYRGSDQYKVYVLPLPFLIYRGKVVEADRDGVRGIFYKGDHLETDISMYGTPPVGDDDQARQGMPELDPSVEIGPAAKWYFRRGGTFAAVYLQAAVRGVVAVETGLTDAHYEGLHGALNLILEDYVPPPGPGWKLGGNVGVDFASRRYNGYFYDVADQYAAPGREPYRSDAGYDGLSVSAYAKRDLTPRLSLAFYTAWQYIGGAVYRDSPLVRSENNFIVGSAVIWTIAQSGQRVPARR